MDDITKRDPIQIRAEDINPRYNWGRPCLPSASWASTSRSASITGACTGTGSAAREQALENSELGALLVFDVNNIRYMTSTKIGEWERDKLSRWALLPREWRPDHLGLRLRRRAPQALFAMAQAGELPGRSGRTARHSRAAIRVDEAPRRGDRRDPAGGARRRQHATGRRHHRAADDVRAPRRPASRSPTASRPCWKPAN